MENKVDGYWYSYDWEIVRDTNNSIPKFTGKTTVKFGNSLRT
jgi:hypothetical protein